MNPIEEFYPEDGYPDLSIGSMMFGGTGVFAVVMIFIPTGNGAPRLTLFGVGVLLVVLNLCTLR